MYLLIPHPEIDFVSLQKYALGRIIGQKNQKYAPGGVFFLGGGRIFGQLR